MDAYVSKRSGLANCSKLLECLAPVLTDSEVRRPRRWCSTGARPGANGWRRRMMKEWRASFSKSVPRRMGGDPASGDAAGRVPTSASGRTRSRVGGQFRSQGGGEATKCLEIVGKEQDWDHAEKAWTAIGRSHQPTQSSAPGNSAVMFVAGIFPDGAGPSVLGNLWGSGKISIGSYPRNSYLLGRSLA